jgi:hypothetical protein
VASERVIRWNKIISLVLLGHNPSNLLKFDDGENVSAEFPSSPQLLADIKAHEAVRATLEAMRRDELPLDAAMLSLAAEKGREL